MNAPNFTIPDVPKNDNIEKLFQEVAAAKAKVKDAEDKLSDLKKEYEGVEELLITAIQETGGEKIEFDKGLWAKITDKFYYNFLKQHKPDLFDWLTELGGDDIISVQPQSLGGFINNRFKVEDEPDDEMLKRLPEFITNYKKTSLTLSTKAVNQFRGK